MTEPSGNQAKDNPAGRLYALLSAARVPVKGNDQVKVRDRWAEVLGVSDEDTPVLLARLSEVIALPSHVRAAIEAIPDERLDKSRYLATLPRIEQAFGNLNLHSQWSAFAKPITADVMVGLGFCDEILSRVAPETVVPEDKRRDFHTQIRDLMEDVAANEEDVDLRAFLLHHLIAMDRALTAYRISGTPPLETAVEAAIGAAHIRRATGKSSESPRLKRLGAIAASILLVLNIGNQGAELVERVFTALPSGSAAVMEVQDNTPDVTEAEGLNDHPE